MAERVFQRWDRSQMRQHQLLIFAVVLLTVTGLPLRFASQPVSQTFVKLIGGAALASKLHHFGGFLLIVVCVWHLLYLLLRRGHRMSLAILPNKQDLFDVRDELLWLIGKRDSEPKYGRYSWIEKFEYWAMAWGSIVMIVTGLILWFPVTAAKVVDGIGIELATVVHGYEALLAALSIAIWHMYHVHLRADVWPMNRMWLTGTMTESEMRHHHPLELEEILSREASAATADRGAGEPPATEAAEPAVVVDDTADPAADDWLRAPGADDDASDAGDDDGAGEPPAADDGGDS